MALRAWVVLTAVVLSSSLVKGQGEQSLDLKRDVLPHISKSFLPEDLPAFSIQRRFTVSYVDGTPSETRESIGRFSPRGGIVTRLQWDKPIIEGYNPWYAFRIERPIEKSEWTLTMLYMAEDPGYDDFVKNIKLNTRYALSAPVHISGISIHEYVTFRSFRVTECRRVMEGGQERIRLSFEVRLTYEEARRYGQAGDGLQHLRGGTIIIDPQRWVTVESWTRWYSSKDSEVQIKNTYDYQFDKMGRLKKRINHVENYEQRGKQPPVLGSTQVIETIIETPEDIPDREFMLTAFGLPEPKGVKVPGPWVPPYVWWLVAGLVLVVVGYLLHRLARKRRESPGMT
jgi:hypothetical protein